ncbi:MAG: VCBS repeat-containing protein [Acidobacteriota bacterium]
MKRSTIISILTFIFIFIIIPLIIINVQAKKKGLSMGEFINQLISRAKHGEAGVVDEVNSKKKEGIFKGKNNIEFQKKPIGNPIKDKPWITHLCINDLNMDGLKDVIICDAKLNEIRWLKQNKDNNYQELVLGNKIMGPAQVAVCDIDKDGDNDLLIAGMGMIFPNNDKIGAVVVLENDGKQNFRNRTLVKNIARVTDVRPGDFDNDGDIDLAVGQFGYDDGEIRWLENLGNWNFKSHIILNLSGTINTLVDDIDKDGDPDIIALVSQEWEEIYIFENDGKANFRSKLIYGSTNEDFGSSGISLSDMDKDGDTDILFTNGDAFDYIPPAPRPWHGVQWLENRGNFDFKYNLIGKFNGAFSGRTADIDNDGDLDVFAVSTFNKWDDKESSSFIWYENDGKMNFFRHNITSDPTHLLIVELADMNGDGLVDAVTGGMHAYPPYDRMSRVLLWENIKKITVMNEK